MTTHTPIARYIGEPCTTCTNAAHHVISASFSACDAAAPVALPDSNLARYVFNLAFKDSVLCGEDTDRGCGARVAHDDAHYYDDHHDELYCFSCAVRVNY